MNSALKAYGAVSKKTIHASHVLYVRERARESLKLEGSVVLAEAVRRRATSDIGAFPGRLARYSLGFASNAAC